MDMPCHIPMQNLYDLFNLPLYISQENKKQKVKCKSKSIPQNGEKKDEYFFPMVMSNSPLYLFFYDIHKGKLDNSSYILHE